MLEQHVILECYSAEAAKDWSTHEVMRIGTEAINDVCPTIVSLEKDDRGEPYALDMDLRVTACEMAYRDRPTC